MIDERGVQHGVLARGRWSRRECEIIRADVQPQLSAGELDQIAVFCQATGLEILAGQVYVARHKVKGGGTKLRIEPTIEGYRAIARRFPTYAGQGNPEWFDRDGQVHAVWLRDEPPAAARIEVYVLGEERPTVGVARYKSYVQTYDGEAAGNWATMPEVMLAAAAERQALTKAFALQHLRGDRPLEGVEDAPGA